MGQIEGVSPEALSDYEKLLIRSLTDAVLNAQAPRPEGAPPPAEGEASVDLPTLMKALAATGGYFTAHNSALTPADIRERAEQLRKNFIKFTGICRSELQQRVQP